MKRYAYSICVVVSFLHDKQEDGNSFMPQESSGTDWYRGKSHVRLFTGL
jgi:hypothetical protein